MNYVTLFLAIVIFFILFGEKKEDELFQELNDHVPPSHFHLLPSDYTDRLQDLGGRRLFRH